ncbi:MAG: DNA ligase [Paenibacillaceae bacterium]
MSPILTDDIPSGEDWVYQLKWDGYRLLARVEQGKVELYSKNMLPQNNHFPELVLALSQLEGTFLLDGEAVVLDAETRRPSFQKLQKRNRIKGANSNGRAAHRYPVQYIIFDLLQVGEEDLRKLPFIERHERLQIMGAAWREPLFLTDLFDNGEVLWQWVEANKWEGIVCKRRSSPYRAGKNHRDWYKRKTLLALDVEIVGILMKKGQISSLVMRKDGVYRGRNSSGLNGKTKEQLGRLPAEKTMADYFTELPEGLRGESIRWLNKPFSAEVTGAEFTDAGTLRHPKIVSLKL